MKKLIAITALVFFAAGSIMAQETAPISLSSEKCDLSVTEAIENGTTITLEIPSNLKVEYLTYLNTLNQKTEQLEIIVAAKKGYAIFQFKDAGQKAKSVEEWNAYLNQLQD